MEDSTLFYSHSQAHSSFPTITSFSDFPLVFKRHLYSQFGRRFFFFRSAAALDSPSIPACSFTVVDNRVTLGHTYLSPFPHRRTFLRPSPLSVVLSYPMYTLPFPYRQEEAIIYYRQASFFSSPVIDRLHVPFPISFDCCLVSCRSPPPVVIGSRLVFS